MEQSEEKQEKSFIRKLGIALIDFLKVALIAALIVLPIRYFLFQPFIVKGESMVPNFHQGDYLIVDEVSYRVTNPSRGDVVVLKFPLDTSQRFIKRIVGLPGETVEIGSGMVTITQPDGHTFILNERYLPNQNITDGSLRLTLGNNEYFVLGDNRPFSFDSRRWGVLPRGYIIGKAVLRVFPVTDLSLFFKPTY